MLERGISKMFQPYTVPSWEAYVERMNEQLADGMEASIEFQEEYAAAWRAAVEEATDDAVLAESIAGTATATEIWMEAMHRTIERATQVAEGESYDPDEFRDVWLRAANDSLQALMETPMFAQTTGASVDAIMEAQQFGESTTRDVYEQLGFATVDHIEEVGDRLVELERRQASIDRKLTTLLERVED